VIGRAGPRQFPPFLELGKASEKALVAAIQKAWVGGVSTIDGQEAIDPIPEGRGQ
jgi:hypothetical protein